MTTEQVRDYLVAHGIDEDTAQEVALEHFLWAGEPIRHPKTWAFKRALWRRVDARRKEAQQPLIGQAIVDKRGHVPALQLRLTEAWQELDRYAASRTAPKGKNKKKIMRWHGLPSKPWPRLPDYLALKSAKP